MPPPKHPIRLLALDLDGTLLNSERKLSPRNRDAVKAAVKQGVTVVLASGRIQSSLKPFADQMELNGPFVCGNGAHVVGTNMDELAFHEVPISVRKTTMDFAETHGIHFQAYTRSDLYFLRESEWASVYRKRLGSNAIQPKVAPFDEMLRMPLSKIMLVGDPGELKGHRPTIESYVSGTGVRLTVSEPEYLEFLAPMANKGAGIQTVAHAMGIPQEQTAAVGDYLNDLEMLEWAGFAASVANATPEAKAISDVCVASNNDDGVAEFIDSYVLNQQE
jgi:Cof subfamily protein (haloacid dehalogenase superfamily)